MRWETDGRKELNEWFQLKGAVLHGDCAAVWFHPFLQSSSSSSSGSSSTPGGKEAPPLHYLDQPHFTRLFEVDFINGFKKQTTAIRFEKYGVYLTFTRSERSLEIEISFKTESWSKWEHNYIRGTSRTNTRRHRSLGVECIWGQTHTFFIIFVLLNNRICSVFEATMTPSVSHLWQHQSSEATKLWQLSIAAISLHFHSCGNSAHSPV